MNKNMKRTIALALTLGAFSVIGSTKSDGLFTTEAYASTSNDADLLGITLSNGTINFNPATTSYEVDVPKDVNSIIVQVTPRDTDDTIKINGTEVDSDDGYKKTVSLSSTTNTITVKVSNDDDSKTYTLKVTKTSTAVQQGVNTGAAGQQGANAQGWKQEGGLWYYLDNNGQKKTGWVQDNGKWYYLQSDGTMARNTQIDGYKLGADGEMVK